MALARAFHNRIETHLYRCPVFRQPINYKTLQQYTDLIVDQHGRNDLLCCIYSDILNHIALYRQLRGSVFTYAEQRNDERIVMKNVQSFVLS